MERSRFQRGDLVIYHNGMSLELGVVNRVNTTRRAYFVHYHTGGTSASTTPDLIVKVDPSDLLMSIDYRQLTNSYAVASLLTRRLALLGHPDYQDHDVTDLIDLHTEGDLTEKLLQDTYETFEGSDLPGFIHELRESHSNRGMLSNIDKFDEVLENLVGHENFAVIRNGSVDYV